MINASVDMLNHLGHKEHARVIQEATYETIVDRCIRTPGKNTKQEKILLEIRFIQNFLLKQFFEIFYKI